MTKTGVWVIIAVAMALGAASTARADDSFVSNIPFDFIVGNVKLPAGDYVVREEPSTAAGVLLITSADGSRVAYTLSIPASYRPSAKPELKFQEFGGQRFLSRVDDGDGNDREIVLTPKIMERELVTVSKHS